MPNLTRKSRVAKSKAVQATLDRRGNRRIVLAAALLPVLATAAAYLNSFNGPFIFDDIESIPHNRTIRQMDTALSPPNAEGITVQGRPILNLSLAVNYALGGTDVWGYHVFNLAIHVLAALALFGIVRRTLLLPSMRDRFGPAAPYLAGAVAMLWALHPLRTESVTYVVQRAESLMGLFYLATLYCAIRSSLSGRPSGRWRRWPPAALGMATKEVMVTAPVIVLLYDRTFLSGSFREAIRKRWGLYAALTACWAVLVCLMVHAGNRGGTAGFGAGDVLDGWSYARTQCWAILKYLLLTLWPNGLCLDYGSSIRATLWQIVPGGLWSRERSPWRPLWDCGAAGSGDSWGRVSWRSWPQPPASCPFATRSSNTGCICLWRRSWRRWSWERSGFGKDCRTGRAALPIHCPPGDGLCLRLS